MARNARWSSSRREVESNRVWASAALYSGIVAVIIGTALWMKPVRRLRATRRRALVVVTAGIVAIGVALAYPVSDSRTSRAASRLDEFVPVWQFQEFHSIRIA